MLARSTLLRRTATFTPRGQQHRQRFQQQQRPFVTKNPHKRALNKKQLDGDKGAGGSGSGSDAARTAAPPQTIKQTVPSSSGGGSTTKPADVAKTAPSSGGGGGLLLPILLLGGAGVGGAYYNGIIPDEYLPDILKGGESSAPPKKKEVVVKVAKELEEAVEEVAREKEIAVAATAEEEVAKEVVEEVKEVEVVEEVEEIIEPIEHPENGNRVDLAKINTFYETVNAGRAKQAEEEAREAAARATEYNESDETQPVDPMSALTTAANAMSELQSNAVLENSQTLAAAKAALRSDLDASYFADLENLSDAQLRVRIVQLATEITDRTKWEAVRLKEFLALKEKEVGDKYLEILQKQRLEFESLLAQRLREQEDQITRQANAALAAKEDSVQSLLKATSDAREQEMQEVLAAETKRFADELELRNETKLQNELAQMKQSHVSELTGHVATMEKLKEKLSLLEGRLEISRNYESGSKRAHLVSAAALALANKLEGGEGAAVELAALSGAVAGEEGVIASAVRLIPRSSAKRGVPTVAELQASFDETYGVGRQAAMVPEGRAGLAGQLLGMLFAKLSVPPSPDAVPTSEAEGSVTDGILSLARKYVQLGDLEKAVQELDRLKQGGQVAYVVKDWKSKAMDRVSTERALKVIKLECALLNKDVVGSES